MNHLPMPVDKLYHPPIDVPFVCNEQFKYDDRGFFTYPHRAGVDLSDLVSTENLAVESLAPFLQAWLWFGLLGEVLYIGSRDDRKQKITSWKEFVVMQADGTRLISTDALSQAVLDFRDKKPSPSCFIDGHTSRVDSCLETAASAVDLIVSSPSFRRHFATVNDHGQSPTTFKVLLSVQILIETLDAALTYLNPHRFTHSPWRRFRSRNRVRLVDLLLNDRSQLQRSSLQIPVEWRLAYFVSFLTPDPIPHINSGGVDGQSQMQASATPDATVTPKHISHGCQCAEVVTTVESVAKIWQQGNVPLFKLKDQPDTMQDLEIIEHEPGQSTDFVAISHVRRAGLGNWSSNALPYCQLVRLQELTNRISSTKASRSNTPLWIDTLALPISTEQKRSSLKKLRLIYRSAAKVLVIDPNLISTRIGGLEDALIRIRYSPWMKRLWTVQEGALGKEAWFAFANQTLCLQTLLTDYELNHTFPILTRIDLWSLPFEASYLEVMLATLDRDLKSVKEIAGNRFGQMPLTQAEVHSIRRAIRFGYMAFPQYRYFRSQEDLVEIMAVLHAMFKVYFDTTANVPKPSTGRTDDEIITDLHSFICQLEQDTAASTEIGYYSSDVLQDDEIPDA